jgi:hypothetical protein
VAVGAAAAKCSGRWLQQQAAAGPAAAASSAEQATGVPEAGDIHACKGRSSGCSASLSVTGAAWLLVRGFAVHLLAHSP